MRTRFTWQLATRELQLGVRTLVMGIVNVTPDSFSDGGLYDTPERAIEHALRLLDEGADILDIGGESTRPGSSPESVSAQQEQDRILPVIEGVRRARPDSVLSVDTYKASVAAVALAAGAEIVNDVSGGVWDTAMLPTVAANACGVVLMHTRGRPNEWANLPALSEPVAVVCRELSAIAQSAQALGIAHERIVLDPGFGFGKRGDENYALLAQFSHLATLGFPLLSAPSRKGFLARAVDERLKLTAEVVSSSPETPSRLNATLAAVTASVLQGAHIVRVHDVRPAVEAVAIADAILAAR
ncbi:MAG TPA: dihydropteroate synthase [Terriglobales bacterium]